MRYNITNMPKAAVPSPKRRHAVIYVPGLGDSRIAGQSFAVGLWKFQGIEPHLFQVNWADGEQFGPKLERLLALIDKLRKEGKNVSLVGASAGGSFVVNAYARRKQSLHGMVGICGKLQAHGFHSVHDMYYRRNPAFFQSMERLEASENELSNAQRQRILSLHPIFDESVPITETKLPGAKHGMMPTAGHFAGIAYGLTLGSFRIMRFLRGLPERTA